MSFSLFPFCNYIRLKTKFNWFVIKSFEGDCFSKLIFAFMIQLLKDFLNLTVTLLGHQKIPSVTYEIN